MRKRNERVLDVVAYIERNLARGVPVDEEEGVEPEERPVFESEVNAILAAGREQAESREARGRRLRLEAERRSRRRAGPPKPQ